ncbi:hypothetical protein PPYR_03949 [Photinus pyralis]|uniref:E3 ubiquitin-protein ligase n=1 Tax=Photinus pyralis TaxID=7054 RepID=A0A1Y1LLZ1_PHOPY|nr:uncharacterized protein LOC116163595 [Photinus pyralis]KAB0801763.1 hypothetical protein PPYR_03949 [Photinus pyralis]
MSKLSIANEVLEKLRCSLCKEYLSQLPVYIYPGQEGTACGRCPVLSEQNPIRDTTYEIIAQYLYFPCRYNPYGCLDNVLAVNMENHEASCSFKQYFCPFIPLASCPWQGPSNELFSHYEEHHKVLALQSPVFEVDLVNMYEDNYMLLHRNETFLIHAKCDSKEKAFWCSVRYIGNKKAAKQYLYQVELKKSNSIENVTLSKKVVESDCSMCLDKNTAVCVKSDEIRKALGDPGSMLCSISITPNEQVATDSTDCSGVKITTKINSPDVDHSLLFELECPVCHEYMVPPIHQCIAGHSICGTCKTQVKNCPTCREGILDTRNFSLEKMTSFINYSCKYSDFDCPFVSSGKEIKAHESTCKYGPYLCPFEQYDDCKWKGRLSDVMEHARNHHEDGILDVGYVTFPFQEDVDYCDGDCFLMQAHNALFKLIFKYDEKNFYWSMQYVGPPEESKNYMYEIDICDNSEFNQRLYIKRKCSNLIENDVEAYEDHNTSIQLPLAAICSLLNEGNLVYKCRIVKV